jgi:hypothetical protein
VGLGRKKTTGGKPGEANLEGSRGTCHRRRGTGPDGATSATGQFSRGAEEGNSPTTWRAWGVGGNGRTGGDGYAKPSGSTTRGDGRQGVPAATIGATPTRARTWSAGRGGGDLPTWADTAAERWQPGLLPTRGRPSADQFHQPPTQYGGATKRNPISP